MKSNKTPERFDIKMETVQNSYPADAPWPAMRSNLQNSGCFFQEDQARLIQDETAVVHFHTGNAVFSTPILDARERIYVGSADHRFYCFDPHAQQEIWSKEFSEVIDSAACMDAGGSIYVAGGDGQIHAFTSNGKDIWTFKIAENRSRRQFTFSTLYWYEANIVVGPDGALYVANDDFFFYKMTPNGEIIWAFRTGFLIWSAATFSPEGMVFIAGFDHKLYALNMDTGKPIWVKNLHGPMVSSPVIGSDGTLYQGSFNGNLYALDSQTGNIKWQYDTGSHIYATPALAPDNIVYVGSSNGIFYALDGFTGSLKWTFFIGESIRSSAAIGNDVEGKVPYLIFFGGGDGLVYALDPEGHLRWAYNSLVQANNVDYPNINSSIALGYSGLAVGSSTGDIIWIPHNYYLREDALGIEFGDLFPKHEEGASWHYITPGGKLIREPILEQQEILPVNIISMRLLLKDEFGVIPAIILPTTLKVKIEPALRFQVAIQSNGSAINIIPEEILAPDSQYTLMIKVNFIDRNKSAQQSSQTVQIKTPPSTPNVDLVESQQGLYKIIHMALPQPTIIPSLNQIGFASLEIPFRIFDVDQTTGKFVAWAVQKFGGEGSPLTRVNYYAFAGKFVEDFFSMEAKNCSFEITAFPIPLDQFRIAGRLLPGKTVAPNGSLMIMKHIGTKMMPLIREMGKSSPLTFGMMLKFLWKNGFWQFFKALAQFMPALFRQISPRVWHSWGLLNDAEDIVGIGTFQLGPYNSQSEIPSDVIDVIKFSYEAKSHVISAEIRIRNDFNPANFAFSIIINDKEAMVPLPVNYTTALKSVIKKNIVTVRLLLPKNFPRNLPHHKAFLFVDLTPITSIEIR